MLSFAASKNRLLIMVRSCPCKRVEYKEETFVSWGGLIVRSLVEQSITVGLSVIFYLLAHVRFAIYRPIAQHPSPCARANSSPTVSWLGVSLSLTSCTLHDPMSPNRSCRRSLLLCTRRKRTAWLLSASGHNLVEDGARGSH